MMLALLLALTARAEDPVDPLAEAHRLSTRGAVLVGTGTASMLGGLAVLLVRNGEPGARVKDPPPPVVNDLRSAGGAVLLLAGFSAVFAGGNDLGNAHALRKEHPAVGLVPTPGGAALIGRF